ncbi:hypothetical protein BDZ94DRAFT_1306731 [Collybia nuda]|uniref:F-box domain-containing protein n=1 Tax=Collybia nuda TaxID=64659 RepID=A0A9P5YC78_9AGAR|nr:hypothetical protein BDZ94DRAFT_1306731 [Collybia nuda]
MFRRFTRQDTPQYGSTSFSMAGAPNPRRRLNVPRLPPEILALIFEFFVSAYRLKTAGYISIMWIAISHVSREWRETALSLPKIWRYIDLTYPTWAYQMLERSIRVPGPVTVAMQLDPSINRRTLSKVYQLLYMLPRYTSARTMEVRVDGDMTGFLAQLGGTPQSGPLVISQISKLALHLGPSAPHVAYPTRHILQVFPNLGCLELQDCPLALSHLLPALQRLVSIKIAFDHRSFHRQTPVHTLLPILACTLALRTLHLEHCLIPIDSTLPPGPHVQLPNLAALYIESYDVVACGHLLDYIILPSSTYIELNILFRDDFLHEMNHLRPILSRIAMSSAPGYPAIHSLEYWDLDDRATFTFQTWGAATKYSHVNAHAQGGPRLKFRGEIDYGGKGSSGPEMLQLLLGTIRPDSMRSLRVAMYPEIDRRQWISWFGPFRDLTTLHVYGDKDRGLLSALSTPQCHGSMTLCFPALRHLTIENWNFDAVDRKGKSCLEQLKMCLSTRQQYRLPLQSLTLVMCRFLSARRVRHLAKLVETTWDGVVNNTESDDEQDTDDDDD